MGCIPLTLTFDWANSMNQQASKVPHKTYVYTSNLKHVGHAKLGQMDSFKYQSELQPTVIQCTQMTLWFENRTPCARL